MSQIDKNGQGEILNIGCGSTSLNKADNERLIEMKFGVQINYDDI